MAELVIPFVGGIGDEVKASGYPDHGGRPTKFLEGQFGGRGERTCRQTEDICIYANEKRNTARHVHLSIRGDFPGVCRAEVPKTRYFGRREEPEATAKSSVRWTMDRWT